MLGKIWPTALFLVAAHTSASAFTLEQAVRRAVLTNPAVAEASANRRATEFELRQNQGALLPQIRVQADIGPERTRQFDLNVNSSRSDFTTGQQANVVVRQLIFDGFATTNEIWRNVARVDASSWRVQERSELVALDTVQSYTDILRLRDMIAQADRNIAVHRKLLSDVEARFEGGRAGRGDRDQVQERVFAAEAARAELEQRLGEGVALFRRSVGQDPVRLSWPSRPKGLPANRAVALELALGRNPTLLAAGSDLDAVRAQRQAANGTNLPTVALEGRAEYGKNTRDNTGRYNDLSAKLSASWLLYSGGTDTARQYELAERVTEQSLRFDVLRRQANESIDRAWSTRAAFNDRIRALTGQVAAAERVINAYRSEYDLGQRTLLDLLNAEQSRYNAQVGLINARGLALFSDYQILAATGTLLAVLRVDAPGEAKTGLRGMSAARTSLPSFDLVPKPPAEMLPANGN
jgi:adhesin transport system outer membrane protein